MKRRLEKPVHYLWRPAMNLPCSRIACGIKVSYGKHGANRKFTSDVGEVSCIRCARRCALVLTDEQKKTIRENNRWRLKNAA